MNLVTFVIDYVERVVLSWGQYTGIQDYKTAPLVETCDFQVARRDYILKVATRIADRG